MTKEICLDVFHDQENSLLRLNDVDKFDDILLAFGQLEHLHFRDELIPLGA